MAPDSLNEYRFAAELAQDANHAAEDGRKIYSDYSYQRSRLIEWDRTIAPQRATMVAFIVLFPIIAFVEYLFSLELYRDILPDFPWVMGIIFAVLAVIIAELLVYRFFEVKRQWKANELKRSEKWKDKVETMIDRHIHKITKNQFYAGLLLLIIMASILSYMSWDRVKRLLAAGESVYSFRPVDMLPVLLYLFEIVTGMFIWYFFLRLGLGWKVRSLKKRFDSDVKRCSELTIDAVQSFNKAEKLGYENTIAKSIHEAFCRNDTLGESNGIDYISDFKDAVFTIDLIILHLDSNQPFKGNVKVITDYRFIGTAGTQDGKLSFTIATFLRIHPEEGNRTEDSICTVIAEFEKDGKPIQKKVPVAIDMDQKGPHTIYI